MNEQLSNTLAEILKAGKDGVVNMALFAQQQAPDLVRQIIAWGICSNLFECVVEVAVILIVWFIYKNWASNEFKENDNSLALMFMIVGVILFVIMFICFINSGECLVKCIVAPKLYLMDFIKGFIPNGK